MGHSERLEHQRASIKQSRLLTWFCFVAAVLIVACSGGTLGAAIVAISLIGGGMYMHRVSMVLVLSKRQLADLEPYLNVPLPGHRLGTKVHQMVSRTFLQRLLWAKPDGPDPSRLPDGVDG